MNKSDFLKFFENALERQPLDKEHFAEILKKGKKSLGNYYDFYNKKWAKHILTELNISGIILEDFFIKGRKEKLILRGKLDKLEFIGNSEFQVNVVDYKTSKPKSRNEILGKTKNGTGDMYRQLIFYKILLDRFKNAKYKMGSAEIDFIEPDNHGRFKKEKFVIEDKEIEELIALIKTVAKEIAGLSFWKRFCDNPNCRYCLLRKSMSKTE